MEGAQKIYRSASNFAMGFAGNIDTALRMIGDAACNVAHSIPQRRGWDSNPRSPFGLNGFQDRTVRPLRHPAATIVAK